MGCSKQFARAAEMFIFYNFEMLEFNMALQKICKHQNISLLFKENINNLSHLHNENLFYGTKQWLPF